MCKEHREALQFPHPSEKTLGKAFSPPPCQKGIPLYPLRYGITDQPYDAAAFPTLSTLDYPKLQGGKAIGLRVLRPNSYVYLFCMKDGRMYTDQYQVTPEGQFARMWWTQKCYDSPAPGRHAKVDMPKPYLLAPETDKADTVYLMVSDTNLTHCALWQIEQNTKGVRDRLTVKVKPEGGPQQHHTLDINQPPSMREIPNWMNSMLKVSQFTWSESRPSSPTIQQIVQAMNVTLLPRKDIVPLAVVLPDVVGVLSELNVLVGARLNERSEYATDAARKLRVSNLIEELLEQARQSARNAARSNDVVLGGAPIGTTGGAILEATERARQAGEKARRERMSFCRNAERLDFVEKHPARLEALDAKVRTAATDLWQVFQYQWENYDALMLTYVDSHDDIETYLDMRCVVGHTLPAMIHCAAGNDYLAQQMGPEQPSGLIHYAVMGHKDISSHIKKFAKQAQRGPDAMLGPMKELLKRFPADGASQQLSLMIGALVSQGKLRSPSLYWTSVYRALMELLDGDVAQLHQVPRGQLANWLRERLGGHGINGFRPTTVSNAAADLIDVYGTAAVEAEIAQVRALSGRLRFWHNVKLGIGGVGLFASVYSANTAFKALGKEDGQALANALDAGGKLVGIGGGAAGVSRMYYQKLEDMAKAQGKGVEHARYKAMAESMERWSLGLAAGAASVIAIKDVWNAWDKEQGDSSAILVGGAAVQGMAAGVGALQVLGKMNSTVARNIVATMGRSSIGAVRGGAAIAKAGSGPIGWTLLALELTYALISSWQKKVADEQKVTTWIARSIWGNGKNDAWLSHGLRPPYSDDIEELRELYRLFQQPQIESDLSILKVLGAAIPINAAIHGRLPGRLPDDVRAITIALPGWKPQISHYKVTQQHAANLGNPMGKTRTHEDPTLIKLLNGVGYLTIESDTVIGTTHAEYHPNGFTDPDYVLSEGNWL